MESKRRDVRYSTRPRRSAPWAEVPPGRRSLKTRRQAGTVYRVGYAPQPWAWVPWRFAPFTGRWDDPLPSGYRVIYAATTPYSCYVEVLSRTFVRTPSSRRRSRAFRQPPDCAVSLRPRRNPSAVLVRSQTTGQGGFGWFLCRRARRSDDRRVAASFLRAGEEPRICRLRRGSDSKLGSSRPHAADVPLSLGAHGCRWGPIRVTFRQPTEALCRLRTTFYDERPQRPLNARHPSDPQDDSGELPRLSTGASSAQSRHRPQSVTGALLDP